MTNSKEYIIEVLKEKYNYEQSRKKYFDDALGVPITLLSFLIAGLYYVSTDKALSNLSCTLNAIKWVGIVFLLVTCIVTLVFLFKVYFGYNRLYNSFPDSQSIIDNDYGGLKAHHSDKGEKFEEAIIDSLMEYTIKWYVDCNTHNTSTNDKRADSFYWARMGIGISLIIGILLFMFTIFLKS